MPITTGSVPKGLAPMLPPLGPAAPTGTPLLDAQLPKLKQAAGMLPSRAAYHNDGGRAFAKDSGKAFPG